ncbi:MAG TPA: hypothetical protein VF772_14785, partial [Terriglobales bacterium]
MRQFVVCLFLAFMLAGRVQAFAQTSPARICVAEVETREPSISPTAVRDALLKFLSKQKGLEAEEVPLDASDSAAGMTQAKDKKCDYAVDRMVYRSSFRIRVYG